MEPMFYQGQAVICIDAGYVYTKDKVRIPLIEGKKYYISNPKVSQDHDTLFIKVSGISGWSFDQDQFIPEEADRATEEMIHEALKGAKILDKL